MCVYCIIELYTCILYICIPYIPQEFPFSSQMCCVFFSRWWSPKVQETTDGGAILHQFHEGIAQDLDGWMEITLW